MNIYVGNISRTATEQDLKDAFTAYGEVSSAAIVKDKFGGESRGFGFVEGHPPFAIFGQLQCRQGEFSAKGGNSTCRGPNSLKSHTILKLL